MAEHQSLNPRVMNSAAVSVMLDFLTYVILYFSLILFFIPTPAHEDAGEDVHEGAEEGAILALVEEEGEAVDLGCRDDEHDHADEDGEVAVGLAGPLGHELAVVLPPLAAGEQQAVALVVVPW